MTRCPAAKFLVLSVALLGFAKPTFAQTPAVVEVTNSATAPVPKETETWVKRQETINKRAQQGDVDLLFIGDSITQGWEGKGKAVWDKYYGRRKAMNAGLSGDRTQ